MDREGIFKRIRDIAIARSADIEAFACGLAKISSQTSDTAGVERVLDYATAALPPCFQAEHIPHEHFAACRYFHHEVEGVRPVALMGHLDTVVPDGFDQVRIRGGRITGPGIADMKGGIAVLVWALRVLDEAGLLSRMSLRILLNTDEEVGSPWSRILVPRFRGCQAGLVFEMGGPDNAIVTTRIGISVFRLTVRGVAAHAGTGRKPKSSAILELAHRIAELENQNAEDFLVNVGTVHGGKAYNFVPDQAEACFAVRFWSEEREKFFAARLEDSLLEPRVPGAKCSLEKISHRPPLQPNAACGELFALCQRVASRIGQSLPGEHRTGGSDAAFLLAEGIPTLDGFGPRGGEDFSFDEFIERESLVERVALVACVLLELMRR